MTAVIFGWGVVVGYFLACSVVRHIERQPIKVDSMKLNEQETEQVLAILKNAVRRKVVK